jgi:hypothetical protein
MKGEIAQIKKAEEVHISISRLDIITRKLFGLLYYLEKNTSPDIDVDSHRTTIKTIAGGKYDNLIKTIEPFKDELLLEAEITYGSKKPEELKRDLAELLLNFEDDTIREEFNTISSDIHSEETFKKIDTLNKRRKELENKRKIYNI